MTALSERRLGHSFGLLGGLLIGLGGLVSFFVGALDLAIGRPFGAFGYGAEGIVLLVVGGLALVFAHLGYRDWSGRPLTCGVLLLVTAALGWAVLGIGPNLLALLGAIFVFLAGLLYLLDPLQRHLPAATPA